MAAFDDREQKDAAVKMVGELDAEIVVLKAERDAARAVIAAAKEFAENSPHGQHGDYGPPIVFTEDLHRLLDQSPGDALAEHDRAVKAEALEEAAIDIVLTPVADWKRHGNRGTRENAEADASAWMDARAAEIRKAT